MTGNYIHALFKQLPHIPICISRVSVCVTYYTNLNVKFVTYTMYIYMFIYYLAYIHIIVYSTICPILYQKHFTRSTTVPIYKINSFYNNRIS